MPPRSRLLAAAALACSTWYACAFELTPTERAWLDAASPVLEFAVEQNLPLDIVVQPDDNPGETPLGMAYLDSRCKLVLSMRGNPEAQATLDRIEPELRPAVVEAITAHEMAHCWRHVQQLWGSLPDRRVDATSRLGRLPPAQAELLREMWTTRREEGYADLVGLAWTRQHHAHHYAAVHAWYVRLRAKQDLDTGPHDTRVWVRLAQDASAFSADASIFHSAEPIWESGLGVGF